MKQDSDGCAYNGVKATMEVERNSCMEGASWLMDFGSLEGAAADEAGGRPLSEGRRIEMA